MEHYVNENYDYLMHHGVKGMKWGVRRNRQPLATSDTRKKFDSTKANYKQAKKDYNKSFNKAYNYSTTIRLTKKGKAERDRRWDDTYDKLDKLDKAKSDYKQAKQERKQQIRNAYRDIDKKATLGDRLMYNEKTREKAAKYMVDNNMSMAEANKRAKSDAIRNTAAFIGVYGAITVAALYKNR